MLMTSPILLTTDGAVATVVLNNPAKMNAITLEAWAELGRVMRKLSADEQLRCVVLRGAGEKAFSAGAAIHELARLAAATAPPAEVRMESVSACI